MSTDREIGARLREARMAKRYRTGADAAAALGMKYPTYAGHENGNRGLRSNLERYARFFGVSVDWLLTRKGEGPKASEAGIRRASPPAGKMHLAGRVGAGQVIHPIGDDDSNEYVDAPPDGSPVVEAVEVDGDSMHPAFEHRTILYYTEPLPPEAMLNERAVIKLADGSMVVKILRAGSANNLWTLQSVNTLYPDMVDRVVEWAAPIEWTKRRR